MIVDPEINLDTIEEDWVRMVVDNLQDDPLSGETMFQVAVLLSGLDPTVTRYNQVRSQGRVSFGRPRTCTDGIAVYLAPENGVNPDNWQNEWSHSDNATQWGRVEWDDPDAVAEKLAYIVWAAYTDGQDGDLLSVLDPALALLCHGAADRGRELQVRRGIRAEGRINFDASKGEEGVALFIPDWKMARPRHGAGPAEAHIRSAYGKAPPSPVEARRTTRTITADPEKIDGHW